MDFYTQNHQIRPVRLSESTRQFAHDSLHHKYGLDTRKAMAVSMDHVPDFAKLPPIERHDLAIEEIAKHAPLRICQGEKVSGAATLGLAIEHKVPATCAGKEAFPSMSHLTVDFETVLKKGINHIRRKAESAFLRYEGTEKEPFARSCLRCLAAMEHWHGRYREALKGRPEYRANYESLQRVPFEPATNFREAVQSLWFTFAFLRLCGNWPGIGRIDWHYQNILLAGIDENGEEVTNDVTYLVLDILEELGISDFPTSVRINKNTDEALLRRVAEVMRLGGGTLAVYNEDLDIKTFLQEGYEEKEARKFANDGCWEVQIPGKTYFIYKPFDALQILQKATLKSYDAPLEFADFEALYRAYRSDLEGFLTQWADRVARGFSHNGDGSWSWGTHTPYTPVSLFEEGCVEKGLSYVEGGPIYNVLSPHIGGLADTVNSLYAIKKLVYDEKRVTLPALLAILKNDWKDEEVLRQFALNRYVYYGNDNDEVDAIAARLLSDFSDLCKELNGRCGYRFPAGASTFGRQLEWAPDRLACPHGRRRGEVLAANCSPTPNTDKEGATAIIRSYCKADLSKLATGAALDLKLLPSSVEGEDGLQALMGLMRGFVALGGFFMQPDVVDASLLKEAQKCPEDHQTLSVRVSGWNARFVTLDKQWQDMVIEQNEH